MALNIDLTDPAGSERQLVHDWLRRRQLKWEHTARTAVGAAADAASFTAAAYRAAADGVADGAHRRDWTSPTAPFAQRDLMRQVNSGEVRLDSTQGFPFSLREGSR